MECQIDVNKAKCPCTYEPCSRKGKCCDCICYHLELNELPACVFPPEVAGKANLGYIIYER